MTVATTRPLLILDLDEVQVHARDNDPLPGLKPDFTIGSITVVKRPYLDEFLARVWESYDVAVWSAGGSLYVEPTVAFLMKDLPKPVFVWSGWRTTRRFDHETHEAYYIKDLKKVRKKGFAKERMLIVEDLPRNCLRNFGNAVYIKPFEGDMADRELLHLADYLTELAKEPDFRTVEKRHWRNGYPR